MTEEKKTKSSDAAANGILKAALAEQKFPMHGLRYAVQGPGVNARRDGKVVALLAGTVLVLDRGEEEAACS